MSAYGPFLLGGVGACIVGVIKQINEQRIPRMGKRADVVLLVEDIQEDHTPLKSVPWLGSSISPPGFNQ